MGQRSYDRAPKVPGAGTMVAMMGAGALGGAAPAGGLSRGPRAPPPSRPGIQPAVHPALGRFPHCPGETNHVRVDSIATPVPNGTTGYAAGAIAVRLSPSTWPEW